ncbi:hypothetical protein ACTQ56_01665 [[Clostridium] aminophilum]|uniref:hypothetical protein n=1 Tax=[Clostridium] aminophilum TaxID=1526 RepID=UPI003F997D05
MVKELNYMLQEEDFRNWFHWNVVHNSSKTRKYVGYVLSAGVAAILLIQGYMSAGLNFQKLLPTILLAVGVIFVMGYTSSDRAVERALWKRSGLQRMKNFNAFPHVHFVADEKRITITTEAQQAINQDATHQVISYSQLSGVEMIDRLILIKQPKQIQFVARSAFESQEEEAEFIRFIEERIADAKEHPEEYTPEGIEEEEAQKAEREENAAAIAANPAADDGDRSVAEEDIHRVDTSNMGMLGKIAHMVAADADMDTDSEAAEECTDNSEDTASEMPENADSREDNTELMGNKTESGAE